MADFLHGAQLIPFVMQCEWQSKPSNLGSNCSEFFLSLFVVLCFPSPPPPPSTYKHFKENP